VNAVELHHADGRPAGVWYCQNCRNVRRTASEAEECCAPRICECGARVECPGRLKCDNCRAGYRLERELLRFDRAEKLTDWDGPVYLADQDRYADDPEALVDDLWDEGVEHLDMPDYAWATTEIPGLQFDPERVAYDLVRDMPDDLESELLGLDEFRVACEKLMAANSGLRWHEPDFGRAVLLAGVISKHKEIVDGDGKQIRQISDPAAGGLGGPGG